MPEKISGSDLVWDLAKLAADNNFSIFLLGGFEDTAKLAARKLDELVMKKHGRAFSLQDSNPNIFWSGKNPSDASVIDDINRATPDILLVAYGPIKQEVWIAKNLPKLNIKLAVGLGGTFDYLAGKRLQPPKTIRKIGLEWLWRLITQPYRAGRIWRATYGLSIFLLRYKVFTSFPMRKNVAIVILNNENQILICQRNPQNFYVDVISTQESLKRLNYWQFPKAALTREKTRHKRQFAKPTKKLM